MMETLHLSLYTFVKIIKRENVKNKVPIRCLKQYDLYDATIYRYTNNMGILLEIAVSRKIVSLAMLKNILHYSLLSSIIY